MEPQIKKLLIEAQKGNKEALNEVIERYQDSVYWKALSILHNDADAKDVVQETFLSVHRNINQLQDINKFYSWLMMITINRCNIEFRKNRHLVDTPHSEALLEKKVEYRSYMDPRKQIENEDDRILLEELIDSLPGKQSHVIKLMYFDGMKLAEIASHLNVPVGTVKTRVARGREELKRKVELLEHKEGRKLSFQIDALFPVTMVSVAWVSSALAKGQHLLQYCGSHLLVTSIGAVVVIGGVAGGVSMLQPKPASIPPLVQRAFFSPITYEDKPILDARSAYYACLNFGYDEATLSKQSEEDFHLIKPVYDQLKVSGSPYYDDLKRRGWTKTFESYASKQSDNL